MKPLYVINDLHIGAVRSAGTTQATAFQLRLDLLAGLNDMLTQINGDLLVNGDLFDGPSISMFDLLETYQLFAHWLGKGHKLWLSTGNHDESKNSSQFSSFQFFSKLLEKQFPEQATLVSGGLDIGNSRYVLSHVANQDLLNLELEKVPECDYLFVHTNYDNEFAVESDHSLNLSKEQAKKLPVKYIIFGHEHQAQKALGGKVIVIGNQIPSSVADCLGNAVKCMAKIEAGVPEMIQTWQAEGDFSEQDWRELTDAGRFIRVTGTATAEEAPQVAAAIARFRQAAKALVITNAVKIEGMENAEELALSHEEVTAFNVHAALRELLTDDENKKIDALLEKKNAETTGA